MTKAAEKKAPGRVKFYGPPGTRLLCASNDGTALDWTIPESGILEFDADDQEPVEAIRRIFVPSETNEVSEEPPKAELPKAESKEGSS